MIFLIYFILGFITALAMHTYFCYQNKSEIDEPAMVVGNGLLFIFIWPVVWFLLLFYIPFALITYLVDTRRSNK
jgi:Na+/proline symporter